MLEIGGGNGYQASLIASWGCDVTSIDIEAPEGEPSFFSVQLYDGVHIPFPDETFDIVYSSAVLEHVPEPTLLLKETRRVMKPEGMGIHILPSATWRFWTLAAHYPSLVRRAAQFTRQAPATLTPTPFALPARRRSLWERLRRLLISGAHGEYPSAVSELYFFSRHRWSRVFAQSGLNVAQVSGNGVFYTGYRLFPSLSIGPRRAMAVVLGNPCHVFTVRRGE